MITEKAKLETFQAWCSGKAYNLPNKVLSLDKFKVVQLYIGNVPLAVFRFRTFETYLVACEIAKEAVKKSGNTK